MKKKTKPSGADSIQENSPGFHHSEIKGDVNIVYSGESSSKKPLAALITVIITAVAGYFTSLIDSDSEVEDERVKITIENRSIVTQEPDTIEKSRNSVESTNLEAKNNNDSKATGIIPNKQITSRFEAQSAATDLESLKLRLRQLDREIDSARKIYEKKCVTELEPATRDERNKCYDLYHGMVEELELQRAKTSMAIAGASD